MRILAAAALGLLLVTPVLADDWSTFRDPNGAFSVAFPGSPSVANTQTMTTDGKGVPLSGYSMSSGATVLAVIDSNLSGYKVDPATAVANASGAVKSNAARTESDAPVSLDGQAGRALTVIGKDGNRVMDRVFFVRGHLYQVTATAPANAAQDDSQRFINSFHFAQ